MSSRSTKRICLWSGPRNISTALMYSFAQRQDTKVFDEPLYAHYLKNTNAKEYHPGANEILSTMENDGTRVVENMLLNTEKPVLFFKHMTKHLLDLDRNFMKDMVNILLTREPREMLPSFAKVIDNPTMDDVGYKHHVELMEYFDKNKIKYVVLDSKKVLLNTRYVLNQFCNFIGIPFDENMLKWKAGARNEDGVWAKYWYGSVHKSTGFKKYQPKQTKFPEELITLLNECEPCYEILKQKAIG